MMNNKEKEKNKFLSKKSRICSSKKRLLSRPPLIIIHKFQQQIPPKNQIKIKDN